MFPLPRLLTEFIDTFFRENARRALARDPPLTVREAKERWVDMLEKRNAYYHRPTARNDGGRQEGGGRGRGGGKRGGGSNPQRRKPDKREGREIQRGCSLLPLQPRSRV
jgi:hypothetical protein